MAWRYPKSRLRLGGLKTECPSSCSNDAPRAKGSPIFLAALNHLTSVLMSTHTWLEVRPRVGRSQGGSAAARREYCNGRLGVQ